MILVFGIGVNQGINLVILTFTYFGLTDCNKTKHIYGFNSNENKIVFWPRADLMTKMADIEVFILFYIILRLLQTSNKRVHNFVFCIYGLIYHHYF